jgi:hypothetical protein
MGGCAHMGQASRSPHSACPGSVGFRPLVAPQGCARGLPSAARRGQPTRPRGESTAATGRPRRTALGHRRFHRRGCAGAFDARAGTGGVIRIPPAHQHPPTSAARALTEPTGEGLPSPRMVQSLIVGPMVEIPEPGGLHTSLRTPGRVSEPTENRAASLRYRFSGHTGDLRRIRHLIIGPLEPRGKGLQIPTVVTNSRGAEFCSGQKVDKAFQSETHSDALSSP